MTPTRILAIAGLSTALLSTANAEIEASAGFYTDHIYRGLNLGEDLVDLNLRFSGSTDLADWNVGLGLGLWDGFDEVRVNASVSRGLCSEPFPLVATVGIANTSWSSGAVNIVDLDSTFISDTDLLEPFVGLSTSLGGLNISGRMFFNTSSGSGEHPHDIYYEASASYSADLGGNLSSKVSAGLGIWDTDPQVDTAINGTGVSYSLTGSLHYAASDTITLSVHLSHMFNDDWGLEDETFGGTSVSVSF